jgi:hypothetical protein
MDTKKDFHEAIVNMRNGLHGELDLMFQVEARIMKAKIRTSQERMEAKIEATLHKFQTWLKEVKARADCGRGTGTGMGAAKLPKFNGSISWAVFWCQL